MKKLLVPVLLLCLAHPAWAQTPEKKNNEMKPYFRVGVGYAMPHGGAVQGGLYGIGNTGLFPLNGTYNITNTPTNESETYDLSKVSFSSGVQGVFAFGLMLNKNIGVDMAVTLGLATRQTKTAIVNKQTQTTYTINVTQDAGMPVLLSPSLVIQTGGKINIYARGGITLPLQTAINQTVDYLEETYNPADSTIVKTKIDLTETYRMRFSPGFSGAMGVKYKAFKQATIWVEAGILSMSLYYKESELTSYDVNGASRLNQVAPSDRLTRYDFKGTTNASNNVVPTTQVPFSNFNISAGVMIDLL